MRDRTNRVNRTWRRVARNRFARENDEPGVASRLTSNKQHRVPLKRFWTDIDNFFYPPSWRVTREFQRYLLLFGYIFFFARCYIARRSFKKKANGTIKWAPFNRRTTSSSRTRCTRIVVVRVNESTTGRRRSTQAQPRSRFDLAVCARCEIFARTRDTTIMARCVKRENWRWK